MTGTWLLVPVHSDEAMHNAAFATHGDDCPMDHLIETGSDPALAAVYTAMLSARPAVPEEVLGVMIKSAITALEDAGFDAMDEDHTSWSIAMRAALKALEEG